MKSKLLLAAVVVMTVILAPSCGSKSGGSTGLLVPEDAAFVLHINSKSLGSKLSREDIRQSAWFTELSTHVSDTNARRFFDDPAVTGVDTDADFVVFVKKQGKNGLVVFEGSVKDEAKFAAFLKETGKDGIVSSKGDTKSFTMPGKDGGTITWNKTHFIVMSAIPLPEPKSMGYSKRRKYNDDYDGGPKTLSRDSLIYYSNQVLNLSKSKRLDKDKRFASLVTDGKDFHIWVSVERYARAMVGPSVLSEMGNLSLLVDGQVSATSFNFDKGKITMDIKNYYGSKLSSLLSKYEGKPISEEMLSRLPSQNVLGALAINFNPEIVSEILDVTKLKVFADAYLSQADYSIDELVKANKGDILLAATDFSLKVNIDSFERYDGSGTFRVDSSTEPTAKWIFATSVGDKESFVKLIKVVSQQTGRMFKRESDISYKLENNWFTVGSSEEYLTQFIAGGNTKPAFADKIKGHPIGAYIDLRKVWPVALSDTKKDSAAMKAVELASRTWEDIVGYGGEFTDKALVFHAEINMVDKNTNSLKQLNSFVDEMYKIMKSRRRGWDDDFAGHRINSERLMDSLLKDAEIKTEAIEKK